MNQTLHAGSQFDKGAELRGPGHFAGDCRPFGKLTDSGMPGILLQLFHPERYFAQLIIDLQYLNAHFIADFQQVRRVFDPMPGHLGHMDQTLDAAHVDKRTERS